MATPAVDGAGPRSSTCAAVGHRRPGRLACWTASELPRRPVRGRCARRGPGPARPRTRRRRCRRRPSCRPPSRGRTRTRTGAAPRRTRRAPAAPSVTRTAGTRSSRVARGLESSRRRRDRRASCSLTTSRSTSSSSSGVEGGIRRGVEDEEGTVPARGGGGRDRPLRDLQLRQDDVGGSPRRGRRRSADVLVGSGRDDDRVLRAASMVMRAMPVGGPPLGGSR